MRGHRALWSLLLIVLAGCATPWRVTTPPVPPVVGAVETGKASWYGHPYHGRRTSSGEVYDMHQLTAAHQTLPLGTTVLVTNLNNGRSVTVRINDRGPFVDGRIIDLSYAAARLLYVVGPGVVPARVRVVSLPGQARARGSGAYAIQLGSFSDRANAEALRARLALSTGHVTVSPHNVGGVTYYRVRVG
ncbi:MAG: septal ring lytic transglycosylase RlpA family protein, partial [Candidatus Methylomirabilia bacterium]